MDYEGEGYSMTKYGQMSTLGGMRYKLLVWTLPYLQLGCSMGQRWTDYLLSLKVKVTARINLPSTTV